MKAQQQRWRHRGPVFKGVALTIRPFIKGQPPITEVEGEEDKLYRFPLSPYGRYRYNNPRTGITAILNHDKEWFGKIIANFEEQVLGQDIPIKQHHDPPDQPALGWVTKLVEEKLDPETGLPRERGGAPWLVAYGYPTTDKLGELLSTAQYKYSSMEYNMDYQSAALSAELSVEMSADAVVTMMEEDTMQDEVKLDISVDDDSLGDFLDYISEGDTVYDDEARDALAEEWLNASLEEMSLSDVRVEVQLSGLAAEDVWMSEADVMLAIQDRFKSALKKGRSALAGMTSKLKAMLAKAMNSIKSKAAKAATKVRQTAGRIVDALKAAGYASQSAAFKTSLDWYWQWLKKAATTPLDKSNWKADLKARLWSVVQGLKIVALVWKTAYRVNKMVLGAKRAAGDKTKPALQLLKNVAQKLNSVMERIQALTKLMSSPAPAVSFTDFTAEEATLDDKMAELQIKAEVLDFKHYLATKRYEPDAEGKVLAPAVIAAAEMAFNEEVLLSAATQNPTQYLLQAIKTILDAVEPTVPVIGRTANFAETQQPDVATADAPDDEHAQEVWNSYC